jgi:hypothetical protein
MSYYICTTCGTQHPASAEPPAHCPICEDDRQYIGWNGQSWTTMEALKKDHHNLIRTLEPGLTGIGTQPEFAIAQRALLVKGHETNILWDCISYLDEDTISAVNDLGGIGGIAISHPHYYSSMIAWSQAFDAPIYLHAADRQWVMRPDPAIRFWKGDSYALDPTITLVRCGGHFPGGTVLHWTEGCDGKGALLTGDILTVVSDRRYVSFMYSYPNLIPLPASTVERIAASVGPYEFDRIYGAWWDRIVASGAKQAVRNSASRYIQAIRDGI